MVDRKTLLAIALCFIIFVVWQKVMLTQYPATQQSVGAVTGQAIEKANAPEQNSLSEKQTQSIIASNTTTSVIAREKLTLSAEINTSRCVVSNENKAVESCDLKNYFNGEGHAEKGKLNSINLFDVIHREGFGEISFDHAELAYLSKVRGELKKDEQGQFVWVYSDDKINLERFLKVSPDGEYFNLTYKAQFKSAQPRYAFVSIASKGIEKDPEAQDRQLMYYTEKAVNRELVADVSKIQDITTPVKWIAANSRYFLATLIYDATPLATKALIQPIAENEARISMVIPVTSNEVIIPFKTYFGPKELQRIRNIETTLDTTVDFGWFTMFAYPLLKLMNLLYGWVQNYGVAIILLTLIIKVLTYPLTYKSMKSMKDMAKIQPQLQKLKEKYANDKESLNREMLSLMKTHGYNPMAGCLPMLIQMPVFFALYRVLYGSIELYQAPFAGWITDLSAMDPYYVTPVVLTVVMYIQQKLTPMTATDPAQQKMMQFMPVIFGVFMLTLPSGLTLYMLTNAVASIFQQIILNKKFNGSNVQVLPRTT